MLATTRPASCSDSPLRPKVRTALALREKLQHFANGFDVPANVDDETAAAIVLAEFIRQVRAELELLSLECVKTEP